MRKIFIWIVSIFFLTGCSNISNKIFNDKREEIYRNLYENWQIEKLEIELSKEENQDLVSKYKRLIIEQQRDKKSLEILIDEIKQELANGNTNKLKNTLDPSLKNIFVGNEIEKVDFSKIKIFINKPKFFKNTANNMIAFIVEDRTIYFNVYFSLKSGEWKITEFKERR
ncbi:hypothetical protein I6E31_03680 [Fusobacterium varium]|nr:hypothetical protein [Fusobacterium varium]